MAAQLVHTGTKGTKLYVDTYFWSDPTNRYWTVEAKMYIEQTSGYNVGSWGDSGGSYINDVSFVGSIPYTTSGSTYTIKDWTLVSQGYYNNNGDAPTITINWKWGVNSEWGGCVYPSSSFTITGTSIPSVLPHNPVASISFDKTNYELNDKVTISWTEQEGGANPDKYQIILHKNNVWNPESLLSAWVSSDIREYTFNTTLAEDGYNIGDALTVEVQSWIGTNAKTKYVGYGYTDDYPRVVSAMTIQISVNGSTFAKVPAHISVNGSDFIKINKDIFKVIT